MDFIIGLIIKPFYNVFQLVKLLTGIIILLLPTVFLFIHKGRKALSRYSDIFTFVHIYPLGSVVFSNIIGFVSPYAASIDPILLKLDSSHCVVAMDDWYWLRNPFGCIHAVAITNLGETATGICVLSALQHTNRLRGIPVRVDTTYFKKARGTLTAISSVLLDDVTTDSEKVFDTDILNRSGECVAKCSVTWSFKMKNN